MELIESVDVGQLVDNLVKLLAAYLLALPAGWDREHGTRSAGLRTFPLVALASCGFMLLGATAWTEQGAQARVLEGLITGIGFIGGGAILKRDDRVMGTATAASIWSTGAIGASIALGRLEIAILLSAVTFFTLKGLTRFKPADRKNELS